MYSKHENSVKPETFESNISSTSAKELKHETRKLNLYFYGTFHWQNQKKLKLKNYRNGEEPQEFLTDTLSLFTSLKNFSPASRESRRCAIWKFVKTCLSKNLRNDRTRKRSVRHIFHYIRLLQDSKQTRMSALTIFAFLSSLLSHLIVWPLGRSWPQ